jgi:hypothetical protein
VEQFAVVLDQYDSPPPEKLAVLFHAVCGLPLLDARQRAARAGAIVAERLPGDAARHLQTALGNLGFPSRVVPQDLVPESTKGRRVQLVLPTPQQFAVRWKVTGGPQVYPWSDVLVISAAVVFHERTEQVMTTHENWVGRGHLEVHSEFSQKDVSRDVAMATITLGRSPDTLETLRLRAPEMEYATIFGEENVRPTPLENFCLLLARIGTLATTAHITEETIELIAAARARPRLPKSPRFESEDDFDEYQRWLVTRRLMK